MKKVKEGGLTPSHFDRKADIHELLLISGIYWDLSKVYDHAKKSPKQLKKLTLCLDKYVIFSKKMPFETVCAETLRKYVQNGKAVHEDLFKKAYKKITDGKCFIATELCFEMHSHSLPLLRKFRDEKLARNFFGRGFIQFYYLLGPICAVVLQHCPKIIRKWAAKQLDQCVLVIRAVCRFD